MEEASDAVTEDRFRKSYNYQPAEKTRWGPRIKKHIHCNMIHLIVKLFPILQWIRTYNFKSDFIGDIIAGVTIAIIQIPQGLLNSMVADVSPIVGLYMNVFPVIIYVLMGSSRHVNTGGFAIVSIMIGNLVTLYSTPQGPYTDIEVATAACFMVGVWQALFGVFKLGFLSVLFSESLVSGFTTGVAVHIITSQIKSLFGIKIRSFHGAFKIVYTYYEIFSNIKNSNWIALVMSIGFLIVLFSFNELLRPIIQKKCRFPVPIEIMVICTGTLISYLLDLQHHGITIIGNIPTGFPYPTVPPMELVPNIMLTTFTCAIVAVAVNVSLMNMYARKYNYEVDQDQDLIAHGCANIFGSFFSSLPMAGSLSRSAIQISAGGKSQLTSAVSCFLLIFVLLFIGPLFQCLPHCVLAAIIITGLKGMLFQVKEFPGIYRMSKIDGTIWMSTFLSVILLDIDIGLGVGVLVILVSMLARTQIPKLLILGHVPNSNIYLDKDVFQSAVELPDVLIIQIVGCLNFANCDSVREKILKLYSKHTYHSKNTIILDLVCVTFVDPAGVKCLLSVHKTVEMCDGQLLLCQCNVDVYNALVHCKLFENYPSSQVFPYLQEAVSYVSGRKDESHESALSKD